MLRAASNLQPWWKHWKRNRLAWHARVGALGSRGDHEWTETTVSCVVRPGMTAGARFGERRHSDRLYENWASMLTFQWLFLVARRSPSIKSSTSTSLIS